MGYSILASLPPVGKNEKNFSKFPLFFWAPFSGDLHGIFSGSDVRCFRNISAQFYGWAAFLYLRFFYIFELSRFLRNLCCGVDYGWKSCEQVLEYCSFRSRHEPHWSVATSRSKSSRRIFADRDRNSYMFHRWSHASTKGKFYATVESLILFFKAADVCSPSWDPIIPSIRMSSVRLHDRLCRPCFYISGQRPSWTRNPKGQRIFQSYKGWMFVTSLISDSDFKCLFFSDIRRNFSWHAFRKPSCHTLISYINLHSCVQ